MKTAAWLALIVTGALTASAQAQTNIPTVEAYTVTTYAPTGGIGGGEMAFIEGGTFAFDSDEGTLTGNFLESDNSEDPTVYAMYFTGADDLRFIYATKTTMNVSVLPISVIYGVGFGASDFYVFGGYSFDITSLIDLGDLGGLGGLGDLGGLEDLLGGLGGLGDLLSN